MEKQTDELEITEEGIKAVEKFEKENPEMYFLMHMFVGIKFLEMCKEELDEKDYERIVKSIALGT